MIHHSLNISTKTKRRWYLVLATLLVCHVAASLLLHTPGHLSIDEGIYHLAARDMARDHSLFVWNGFVETPAPELALRFTRPTEKGLAPIYPPGMAVAALPVYDSLGFSSLFLVNNLSFLGTLLAIGFLARRLGLETDTTMVSVLVFGLGTYSWQYSQAAWPHALAVFAVTTAAAILAMADSVSRSRAISAAAVAGALLGLGTWVRIDVAFAIPCLGFALWVLHPAGRGSLLLSFAAGASSPLAGLAWVNHQKFGEWTPFTYGVAHSSRDPRFFLPLIGAFLLVVVTILGIRRLGDRVDRVGRGWPALLVLVLLLALPFLWVPLERLVSGGWRILVDLRALVSTEPGMTRSPTGGILYFGHLKKALLQSCPYLPIVLVLVIGFWKRGREWRKVLYLLAVPAGVLPAISFLGTHGGLCLNQRYLLPALPFTSILVAWALRETEPRSAGFGRLVALGLGGIAVAVALRLPAGEPLERALLTIPLLGAATIAVTAAGGSLLDWRPLRRAARYLALAGIAWASGVAFLYDAPATRELRQSHLEIGRATAEVIEPDSILFTPFIDPFFQLADHPRTRLAWLRRHSGPDWVELARRHDLRGHPVYLVVPNEGLAPWLRFDGSRRWVLTPVATPLGYQVHRLEYLESAGDLPEVRP